MTVTSIAKDPAALTMTITSEFDAPIDRVWSLWEDPRQLERWWGPPTYPATVVDHDLSVGGSVTYYMTGPDGDQPRGWWRILAVDAPRRLEFEDGFADDTGEPNPEMPTVTMRVTLDEHTDGHTRMVIETTFPSTDAMERLVATGMEEGMSLAVGQIDDLLHPPVQQ
ncbi:MAG TPA: SRPBCC domain-containing protein [Acidimicrobiales bacterium]|jgi:uncharacterized protein YndB with AHSA1/START domain|nr:SRPBCC domain-containing protein [Acidimicrobiales bacterium]